METNQRFFWLIPLIITLVIGSITIYTNHNKGDLSDSAFIVIISILGAIFFFILSVVIFYSDYMRLFKALHYWIKKWYTDFIFNSIKTKIEYLKDDGSLVAYERADHITKLSLKRSKRMVNVTLEFDGKIVKKDAHAINSTFSFPSEKSAYVHCYFKNKNILGKAHHSKYYLTAKNSFLGKEQYWIIGADNFCNYSHLDIVLPKSRPIASVTVFYSIRNLKKSPTTVLTHQGDWVKVNDPKFIIARTKVTNVISMKLVALKPADLYKIVWVFAE